MVDGGRQEQSSPPPPPPPPIHYSCLLYLSKKRRAECGEVVLSLSLCLCSTGAEVMKRGPLPPMHAFSLLYVREEVKTNSVMAKAVQWVARQEKRLRYFCVHLSVFVAVLPLLLFPFPPLLSAGSCSFSISFSGFVFLFSFPFFRLSSETCVFVCACGVFFLDSKTKKTSCFPSLPLHHDNDKLSTHTNPFGFCFLGALCRDTSPFFVFCFFFFAFFCTFPSSVSLQPAQLSCQRSER